MTARNIQALLAALVCVGGFGAHTSFAAQVDGDEAGSIESSTDGSQVQVDEMGNINERPGGGGGGGFHGGGGNPGGGFHGGGGNPGGGFHGGGGNPGGGFHGGGNPGPVHGGPGPGPIHGGPGPGPIHGGPGPIHGGPGPGPIHGGPGPGPIHGPGPGGFHGGPGHGGCGEHDCGPGHFDPGHGGWVHDPYPIHGGLRPWPIWDHPYFPRPIYGWNWGALELVTCTAIDEFGEQFPVTEDGYHGFGYQGELNDIEDNAMDRCYAESEDGASCSFLGCTPGY